MEARRYSVRDMIEVYENGNYSNLSEGLEDFKRINGLKSLKSGMDSDEWEERKYIIDQAILELGMRGYEF
jgi:hypothetical protein